MTFKQDTQTTDVLFRMMHSRHGAYVVALFPNEPGTYDPRTCADYVIVGQHGSADPHYVIANSRRATPEEYEAIKTELESAPFGYRLRVLKRMSHQSLETRRAALRRIA